MCNTRKDGIDVMLVMSDGDRLCAVTWRSASGLRNSEITESCARQFPCLLVRQGDIKREPDALQKAKGV
jgi:hypothetical protein